MRIHDRALLRPETQETRTRPTRLEGAPAPVRNPTKIDPLTSNPGRRSTEDAFLCDRCGVEMYRMHAVWRCPSCGFKTDCCGW